MTVLRAHFTRVLVVEDDRILATTILDALMRHDLDVRTCGTLAEARAYLDPRTAWVPELILLDVALPDGSSLALLRELDSLRARPVLVAMSGEVRPEESFELAQLGVQRFLAKPIDLAELEHALVSATTEPPDLRPQLKMLVGRRSIQEVEEQVRAVMVGEAMAKAGSISAAARLLSISRQLLQHILRQFQDGREGSSPQKHLR